MKQAKARKRMHERVRRTEKKRTNKDMFRTLKTPMIKATIQTANTALFIFSSVMIVWVLHRKFDRKESLESNQQQMKV